MSFDFLDRRSAERFAELLDETTDGRRHHVRGGADDQLAELVAIGHSLSGASSGVQVEPEFRTGLRAMLVAAAERDGIGRTAQPDAEPAETAVPTGRRLFGRGSGRRIRARGAIVIGVAAGALAVSGISAASENAAPGDALYGVKRSTERAQLAMAGSDLTRGQLSLDFARHRLTEAAALPGDNARFSDVLDDMDNDTRQGVRLLTGSAVARSDTSPLKTIDTFVTGQRSRMAPVLDDLAPANRERAVVSMNLLDEVRERSTELQARLACEPVTQDGGDTLGPKLRDCGTDPDDPQDPSTPHGQQATGEKPGKPADGSKTSKADPARNGPATNPSPTGNSPTSGSQSSPASPATPAATADTLSDETQDPGKQDDSGGGPLGGLLEGIFGGG